MQNMDFYLRGTTLREVGEFLSATYTPQFSYEKTRHEKRDWMLLSPDGSTLLDPHIRVELYIHLRRFEELFEHDGFPLDEDGEERREIVEALGYEPVCVIGIDISGNRRGDERLMKFVRTILSRFDAKVDDGVAFPLYMWTLAEIERGDLYRGHPFWDSQGWYQERVESQQREGQRLRHLLGVSLEGVEALLERGARTYEDLEVWEDVSQNLFQLYHLWGQLHFTPEQHQHTGRLIQQFHFLEPRLQDVGLRLPAMPHAEWIQGFGTLQDD